MLNTNTIFSGHLHAHYAYAKQTLSASRAHAKWVLREWNAVNKVTKLALQAIEIFNLDEILPKSPL